MAGLASYSGNSRKLQSTGIKDMDKGLFGAFMSGSTAGQFGFITDLTGQFFAGNNLSKEEILLRYLMS